jgi:hypothetical protein
LAVFPVLLSGKYIVMVSCSSSGKSLIFKNAEMRMIRMPAAISGIILEYNGCSFVYIDKRAPNIRPSNIKAPNIRASNTKAQNIRASKIRPLIERAQKRNR